ncbi:MAG TPA: PAS domain-containing protein [Blastocatellia bacterium]|nr:PAS domain-containing protein [Blastocatellia bacterium]
MNRTENLPETVQPLRDREELFRQMVENTRQIVFLADAVSGRVIYVNPAFEKISGHPCQSLCEQPESWLEIVHPDDQPRVRAARASLTRSSGGFILEYRILRPDGTIRWLRNHTFPITDETGWISHVVGVAEDITDRRQTEEQLRASGEQLRQFAARVESVREEERSRIAREVHDELAQSLTALRFGLWWLDHRLAALPGEELQLCRERAADMMQLVDQTIKSVQRIATDLRPSILDSLGLLAAIEWLAQDFQTRTGISLHLTSVFDDAGLDKASATALFRILQEALTNISRHSGATRADISLSETGNHLMLEIRDNGRGITADELQDSSSLGLLGMRERALLLGGDLSITGRENEGTTVLIRIPLRRSSPSH